MKGKPEDTQERAMKYVEAIKGIQKLKIKFSTSYYTSNRMIALTKVEY